MQHFKNIGRVVYLHVEYDRLVKRLSDIKQRGVVIRDGQTFEQLYDERVRLYNKYADITVTENCENVETVLADLIKELGEV